MSPEAGDLLLSDVAPRLASAIPNAVPFVAPENIHELVQDGIAIAAQMMHNIEQAGKKVVRLAGGKNGKDKKVVTAGNVAYYTIVKLRNGRRSTGSSMADVHGVGTQINGRSRLMSMDEPAASDDEAGAEMFEFHDVLACDQEDPGTKAARKMDWDTFMAGLSDREQAIIEFMAEGKSLTNLARKRGCDVSTLRTSKERLAKAIAEFMGANIMVEVQRQPQWKDSLTATKERMAVRYERCH